MSVKANVQSTLSDPSNQFAGVAGTTGVDALGNPIPTSWVASPGTLDSLFSDTVDLPGYQLYRGIYVGVAGDLACQDWDGKPAIFKALTIGFHRDICPRRILVTGTAATNVIGLR